MAARIRTEPDQAALEVARRMLCTTASLADLLKNPALKRVLHTVAHQHMKRRDQVDVKKLQANDND